MSVPEAIILHTSIYLGFTHPHIGLVLPFENLHFSSYLQISLIYAMSLITKASHEMKTHLCHLIMRTAKLCPVELFDKLTLTC